MINYCTLFDSGYLDKGCLMIESLINVSSDAHLYVLAFDDKCYEVLNKIDYKNVTVISLSEFESERILRFKSNRSHRSYCWSCTPFLIKHVLENYNVDNCTYIDADMLFYKDPNPLVMEIKQNGCNVGIVEHRFGKGKVQEEQIKIAGRYCVEFNTFLKNSNSQNILDWWADKCEECCTDDTSKSSDGMFGDQMYLTDWTERFEGVYVMSNHGGGMAPWNIYRYRLIKQDSESSIISFRDTQGSGNYELIFYHFHDINMFSDDKANINVYGRYGHPDRRLVNIIYKDYLGKLRDKRQYLHDNYALSWNARETSTEHMTSAYPSTISKLRHLKSYINKSKNILSY